LQLIPVRPEEQEAFCDRNAHRILTSGESPLAALQAFDALPLVFSDGQRPSLLINAEQHIRTSTDQQSSFSRPSHSCHTMSKELCLHLDEFHKQSHYQSTIYKGNPFGPVNANSTLRSLFPY
jgi:hypothetical protein